MSSNPGPSNIKYHVDCSWNPIYKDGVVTGEGGAVSWYSVGSEDTFYFSRSGSGEFCPSRRSVEELINTLRKHGDVRFKETYPDGHEEKIHYLMIKEETSNSGEAA